MPLYGSRTKKCEIFNKAQLPHPSHHHEKAII